MRRTPKLAIPTALCLLALLAGAALRGTGGEPAGRPLLISVDDLPVAAGDLHADPAERERITQGCWRRWTGTTSAPWAW